MSCGMLLADSYSLGRLRSMLGRSCFRWFPPRKAKPWILISFTCLGKCSWWSSAAEPANQTDAFGIRTTWNIIWVCAVRRVFAANVGGSAEEDFSPKLPLHSKISTFLWPSIFSFRKFSFKQNQQIYAHLHPRKTSPNLSQISLHKFATVRSRGDWLTTDD